jgi:hypothetical protein
MHGRRTWTPCRRIGRSLLRNSRGNWSCPRQTSNRRSSGGALLHLGQFTGLTSKASIWTLAGQSLCGPQTHCGRANAADRPPDSRRALDRPFQFQYIGGMTSKIIETRAHTTKDGRLNLSVAVDIADVDVAVVVTVTPVAAGSPVDENGWPEGFFDHVAGSMPGLRRASQGDFEERLPIE